LYSVVKPALFNRRRDPDLTRRPAGWQLPARGRARRFQADPQDRGAPM